MKYVLTAQDYGFTNENSSKPLLDLVQAIPQTIWESLDSIQLSFQEATAASHQYQQVLLESFDEIEDINESQHILFFANISEVGLISSEAYRKAVNEAMAVYESLWSSVKNFISALTEGGSVIGIIHLILDIIGLVPGSWVGFPIDVVANLLNAIIYGIRGMWFLAILSAIAAIPANYLFKGLKLMFTPFAKILDKLGIAVFKADSAAIKIASSELKAAAGVDKASTLANGLSGFIGFIKGSLVTILKAVGSLIGKVVSIATFGTVKADKFVKFIETNIEVPLMKAVKGSEEAVIALKSGDDVLSASTKTDVKAVAAAKGVPTADIDGLVNKFNKLAAGDGDLVAKATNSRAFKEMVEAGAPKAAQEAYVNAAVARMSFTDAITATDKILANPQAVRVLRSAGWVTDPAMVKNAINAGDDAVIGKLFKEITEDPLVLKTLSEGEATVLRVYSKYPKDFIKHGRHFDDYLTTLTKIGKRFAYREKIGRRLLLFVIRQTAKYIMNHRCYEEWKKAILGVNSTEELADLGATQVLKESEDPAAREKVKAQILKEYQIEESSLNDSAKAELNACVDEAMDKAAESKDDCGLGSDATNAVTGSHILSGPYTKENQFGEKILTDEDYEQLIGAQKEVLKYLKLDANIDPLPDMTNSDPIVEMYFSDVYDADAKMMYMNIKDESNLEKVAQSLRKSGKIKSNDEMKRLVQKVQEAWDKGLEPSEVTQALPEAKTDTAKMNESVRINKNNQFMTFEQFKNFKN